MPKKATAANTGKKPATPKKAAAKKTVKKAARGTARALESNPEVLPPVAASEAHEAPTVPLPAPSNDGTQAPSAGEVVLPAGWAEFSAVWLELGHIDRTTPLVPSTLLTVALLHPHEDAAGRQTIDGANLDIVEAVMDLEDLYGISIPDETVECWLGKKTLGQIFIELNAMKS